MTGKTDKILLPAYPTCFVCGRKNSQGLQCDFYETDQGVEALFTTKQFMAGYGNMVHGGVISAVLDDAIVWAVYAAHRRMGVTGELNVRFAKPVVVGGTYTVRGRCTDKLRRLVQTEAELMDDQGNIMASCTGRVLPFTPEQIKNLHRELEEKIKQS